MLLLQGRKKGEAAATNGGRRAGCHQWRKEGRLPPMEEGGRLGDSREAPPPRATSRERRLLGEEISQGEKEKGRLPLPRV